jgi:hypothetical protein
MKKRATSLPNKICSQSCANGNPYRGYLCSCNKCKGKAHGALKINYEMLLEIVDSKLMDFTMPKSEWQKWLRLQSFLVQHEIKTRARRAA